MEIRYRECETLLSMLAQMPTYPREQYEAEEPEHWARRLTRQFMLGQRGDFGNLDAILQMATVPGAPKPSFPVGADNIITTFLPEVTVEHPSRNLPAGSRD